MSTLALLVVAESLVWHEDGLTDAGETVCPAMVSIGWECLKKRPRMRASSVCHGDVLLADGSENEVDDVDRVLRLDFEVTTK